MNDAMELEDARTGKVSLFTQAVFYAVVFLFAAYLFYVQAFSKKDIAEFQSHIALARAVAGDPFSFQVPHPGYHWMILVLSGGSGLSLTCSGILVLSAFVVIISMMINQTLVFLTKDRCSEKLAFLIGAGLMLVSAIYFPPVSKNFYLGQGSPNFWAVPTLIVVKPFALASILLLVSLQGVAVQKSVTRHALLIALSLLVSVIMKPNFVLGFLPVVVCYVLLKWQAGRGLCWAAFLALLPAMLFMFFQYYINYHSSASGIALTWFGVWKLYSNHIFMSILLGVAFPLSLLIFRFRSVMRNDYLLISWLFYGVTLLQFAFLAERTYFSCGNFGWGYNIALWVLFIFSAAEFLRWVAEEKRFCAGERAKIVVAALLFSMHLVSGLAYLIKQLAGGPYY